MMPLVLRRLLADPVARVCLAFLAAVTVLGLCVPLLPLPDPTHIELGEKFLPPGAGHWAGTDMLGRDLFSRLLWGIRSTFFVSVLTMLATASIGALYGSRFPTNSAHHEAVGRLGQGLAVDQRSEDGVVEGMHHVSGLVHSVQWHPERMCFRHRREDTVDGSIVLGWFLKQCEAHRSRA